MNELIATAVSITIPLLVLSIFGLDLSNLSNYQTLIIYGFGFALASTPYLDEWQ